MLKIISLNLVLNKHFSKNIPFLKKEKPDVLCVQELFKKDIQYIKDNLGFQSAFFAPMYFVPYFDYEDPRSRTDIYDIANKIAAGKDVNEYDLQEVGIGIFSNKELKNELIDYFNPLTDGRVQLHDAARREETVPGPLLSVLLDDDGRTIRIVNTHFTWSGKGEANDLQRADIEALLGILSNLEDCVLCGDFNAPRGDEIYTKICGKFKDNIPLDCDSTIDSNFHRAGNIKYVVDGIFSTPEYTVSDVRICDGVSDHKAIVAMVSKSNN